MKANVETKNVFIPAAPEHQGVHGVTVTVAWTCPICGGPRGKVHSTRSYDGSRILFCDGWENPCGHTDFYPDVIQEARTNGLNKVQS